MSGSDKSSIERALERIEGEAAGSATRTLPEGQPDVVSPEITRIASQVPEKERVKYVHKLDLAGLAEAGFIVPDTERSSLLEEYRILKRPVLMNAFGRGAAPIENGNVVMITSTVPGEGKTFTTINAAMSMAVELDTTVLLVDADVIRTTLTSIFGLRDRPGLVDVLLDKDKEPSDVIVQTDIEKLCILPAGRSHIHSTELLSSEKMRQFMLALARRFPDRVILLDSPPLLAASESMVLSDLAGQILVVVEYGKTQKKSVEEAVATLDKNKAIGLVLNKSNRVFRRGYYYGTYGSKR